MAPKPQIKKLRPSEAVRSLELYNEKVFALVQQCSMALQHNLVDNKISGSMTDALKEVKEFYESE